MAVTVERFVAVNTIFDGRRVAAIEAALDEAAASFSAEVCGELHDSLVMAQAAVTLLQDPNGLPTSATGDKTDVLDNAKDKLLRLKRLVPVRGLGTRGCE